VVVQAVEGRDTIPKMTEELRLSDVSAVEFMYQPPDKTPREHFLGVLRRLQEADTDLVLRLEDDCAEINRHLQHNLLTWPETRDPHFGAGWGFRPGGCIPFHQRWHPSWRLHGSLCTLFRRQDLAWLLEGCQEWFERDPAPLPQDLALSYAVWARRKKIALHTPSLVENNIHRTSTLGHRNLHHHTSAGTFSPNWRRC